MEFRLGEQFFPYVPMIRGELEQTRNPAGMTVAPERDARENKPADNCYGLQTCEPILGEPMKPVHPAIVARSAGCGKGGSRR